MPLQVLPSLRHLSSWVQALPSLQGLPEGQDAGVGVGGGVAVPPGVGVGVGPSGVDDPGFTVSVASSGVAVSPFRAS